MMMKKITVLLCSLVLAFTCTLPTLPAVAYADEAQDETTAQKVANEDAPDERQLPRFTDDAVLLTSSDAESLNETLNALSDELNFDVVIHTTSDLGDKDITAYADDFYDYNGFGYGENHDGLLLVISMGTNEWYISTTGEGIEAFTDDGINYIGNQIVNDLSSENYLAAFSDFATYAEEFVLQERAGEPFANGQEYEAAKAAQAAIPDERQLPRFTDDAELLTSLDGESLNETLDALSEELSFDVVIHTTPDMGDKDVVAYADDFYDYNGFGYGEDHDGVILVVCMSTRDWYISTTGEGITAFTDAGIEYIGDQIVGDLGSENYYSAFSDFATYAEEFVLQERNGEPYDEDNMPHQPFKTQSILYGGLVGFVAAFFMAKRKKSSLTTVAPRDSAQNYAVDGSINITHHTEHFDHTDHKVISLSSDSDSGGSSTHVGSSGTSHGGGGGKF